MRALAASCGAALLLAGCSNTEGPISASTSSGGSTKSDLAARSEAALNDLYAKQPATRERRAHQVVGALRAGRQTYR